MTAALVPAVPFVTAIRSRRGIVRVGSEAGERITVRVEFPEQWETIAFDVRTSTPVRTLKSEALREFGLGQALPEDFVLKLRGFEVLSELEPVADSGARDGSTFLVTHRHRRPVR